MDGEYCKPGPACQAPSGETGFQCGSFCINPERFTCNQLWSAGHTKCVVQPKQNLKQTMEVSSSAPESAFANYGQ